MSRAIQLANMADGSVFPNPFVGAVVVHDEKIIGEGYHQKYGEAHAEVNAINQVQDQALLKNSTIYVTLEPCSHFGKTPPCADLIIHHQFKRVVIGSLDPFPQVNGTGVQRLRNAGIEVETGVLEEDCNDLNKRFFTFHQKKRPYITAKWAESKDGFLSSGDEKAGERTRITGEIAHQLVHLQRSKEHGILVGKNTVIQDNPKLTVRGIQGKNPIRLVLDSNLSLSADYHVFQDGQPTTVLNTRTQKQIGAIQYVQVPTLEINQVLKAIYDLGIISVYIEGGRQTIQSFLNANAIDRIYRFIGKHDLGSGILAPDFRSNDHFKLLDTHHMEQDCMEVYEKV